MEEEKYTPKAASHLTVGILELLGAGEKISDCRQTGLHSWLMAHGSLVVVSSSAIGHKIPHLAELLEVQGSFRRVR